MQIKQKISLVISLAALASAQSLSSLPTCATQGALAAIGATGCGASDTACICNSRYFSSGLEKVAKQSCSQAEYINAVTIGRGLCAQVGIEILATVVLPSTSALSTSSPLQSASSTMSLPMTSPSASMVSVHTIPTNAPVVMPKPTMDCDCEDDTPVSTMTSSAPVATWTGGAMVNGVGMQGVVAGVAGILVLIGLF